MGRALDTEKCQPLVDEIATSVAQPGAIVSPGAPEDARRLHLHALDGGVVR